MSSPLPELAAIAYFVVIGWIALWPMRERLGAFAYHTAALPSGMLAAPLAAAFTTTLHRPLDFISAAVGGLLLVAAVWAVTWLAMPHASAAWTLGGSDAGGVAKGFGLAAGAYAVVAGVLGVARFTIANADSYVSYWPLGVELSRTGAINERVFASRAQLLPSLSAIHVTFGSDWAYVIYPMVAVTLLVWIATTLWSGPLRSASTRTKLFVSGAAVGFLALEPSFVFHSIFVHSHMISATYLLMSLSSLWVAARTADEDGPNAAWLIVAGAFAAGLALTRTDGLAYEFVPVATAIGVLTLSKVRLKSVVAFFAPMMFVIYAVFAAGYAGLGMWKDNKLSGKPALMILGVLAVAAVSPWIVEQLDRRLPFRVAGERFMGLLVSVSAVLLLAVFVIKWDSARLALANTRINLFEGAGGYFYLWYAVVILTAISAFTGDALRPKSWTRGAFLGVALFFVIAGLVHGTAHAGRIGVGDSLNRIVFHVVPVVVWYVSAVVARILSPAEETADAEAAPTPQQLQPDLAE